MNPIETMHVFVRVADLASFTQAGESMGLPKTSISNAVQQLEAELGTRLLHRTTRRVQLTQDGQIFYERCKDVLADMDELLGLFRDEQSVLHGRLRVDMPSAVAREMVLPRLPDFMQANPALEIELSSTDRRVDLIREGFDCVLRVGILGDSSHIARPLGHYRMINCASAAYVERFGQPDRLDELSGHRLIHYVSTLGAHDNGFEYVDPEDQRNVKYVDMPGTLTVTNSDDYMGACLAGLGIIQVPHTGALAAALASGRLIELMPRYRAAPMPVSLIYANRRHQPRRVQVFMTWLETIVRPRLTDDRSGAA